MSDPSAALQDAIETALRADADVKAEFTGGTVRLYTLSAPMGSGFPYILIGEDQVIGADIECGPASDIAVTVHVFAREEAPAASRRKAKTLAGAVRAALTVPLAVTGHTVTDWIYETTRHLTDLDGLTAHSVVELTYLTAPSA